MASGWKDTQLTPHKELLFFNEPNEGGQANITAQEAAKLWIEVRTGAFVSNTAMRLSLTGSGTLPALRAFEGSGLPSWLGCDDLEPQR